MNHGKRFLWLTLTLIIVYTSACLPFVWSIPGEIQVDSIRGNLRCLELGNGAQIAISHVGSLQNLICASSSSTYTRIVFNASVSAEHGAELHAAHQLLAVKSEGSSAPSSVGDGCADDPTVVRSSECTKMGIVMQAIGNGSISLLPGPGLQHLLGLSVEDMGNLIQGLEIDVKVGRTRWAYDLSPVADHIFPYAYELRINDTVEAYQEAIEASLLPGTVVQLSRCEPNVAPVSGRLAGRLGGCFRAPCNCTGAVNKTAGVPDLYTYEVHWVSPSSGQCTGGGVCQVRTIRGSGSGRITANATVQVFAVTKLRGKVIDRRSVVNHTISDLTSTSSFTAGMGSLGGSGIQDTNLAVYGGSGSTGISVGSRDVRLSSDPFGGGQASGPVIKFRAELIDSFIGGGSSASPKLSLGSTEDVAASVGSPNLSGGSVIDCMSDSQVLSSPYRTTAESPYFQSGIYVPSFGSPNPDCWAYLPDGLSRRGVLFSTHLRGSCGLIGTSSASIAFDTELLENTCCNGNLTTGQCLPGQGDDAFFSPQEMLSDGATFASHFSPPAWNNYNYYMRGRTSLNIQPGPLQKSGLDPTLFGAPTADFRIVVEISDAIFAPLTGGSAQRVNIPPLRLERHPDLFEDSDPVGCIFSTDGSGTGIIYVQRLCNSAAGSAFANVSFTFDACTGIKYVSSDGEILHGPYDVPFPSLPPGACYDTFSFPIHVPDAVDVFAMNDYSAPLPSCALVLVSSTLGSTVESSWGPLTCFPVYGRYGEPAPVTNSVVTDIDVYRYLNCSTCSLDRISCLHLCGDAHESPYLWVVFIFPVVILFFFLIAGIMTLLSNRSPTPKLTQEDPKK
jgi:hypothetical protein